MNGPGDVTRDFIAVGSSPAVLAKMAGSLQATPGVQDVKERNDLGLLEVRFSPQLNAAEIAAIQNQFPDLSFEPNADLHLFQ
jgi:hypothetical protein